MKGESKYQINKPEDIKRAYITTIVSIVLIFLFLFLMSFELADPPASDADLTIKADSTDFIKLTQVEFDNLKVESGGGSSGDPSDDPIDKPQDQTEDVITQNDSKVKTPKGQSNKTNANNSDNDPSTVDSKESDNPFGGGNRGTGSRVNKIDGGSGGGEKPGGRGKKRIRLKDPTVPFYPSLKSNKEYIHLKVEIDENGKVVSARNLPSKTTTTDQIIINDVIIRVKKTAKYDKNPGAPLAEAYITVRIQKE